MGDDNIVKQNDRLTKEIKQSGRSKSGDDSDDEKALIPSNPIPSTSDLDKTVNPVSPASQFTGPPPTAPVKVIKPIQVPTQQPKC